MRDVARRERIRAEVEANRVVARTKDAFASALHLLDIVEQMFLNDVEPRSTHQETIWLDEAESMLDTAILDLQTG
jgi:hypothetical protein